MFCEKCGNQIPDGSAFCVKCGAKNESSQPSSVNVANNGEKAKNGDSVAALVFGILGMINLMGFGIVFDIVAITLGVRGLKKADESGVGKGISIAGMACGIIGAVIFLIQIIPLL